MLPVSAISPALPRAAARLASSSSLRSPPAVKSGLPTGGIRLTIARFFSPTGQPYSGRGVEPDIFTEGESEQLATAQRLLAMVP